MIPPGKKYATLSICQEEVSRQSLPCVLKTSLWQFSNTLPAIRLGDIVVTDNTNMNIGMPRFFIPLKFVKKKFEITFLYIVR